MRRYRLALYYLSLIISVLLPFAVLASFAHHFAELSDYQTMALLLVLGGLTLGGVSLIAGKIKAYFEAELRLSSADKKSLEVQRGALLRLATSKVLYGDDLNLAIQELSEITADTLSASRVGVWLFEDNQRILRCINEYDRKTQRHNSGAIVDAEVLPRYFQAVRNHRLVVANDVRANPITNNGTFLSELKITALIDVPIYVNGALLGVICHEMTDKPRVWTADEQNFCVSVADMVAMAFEVHERRKLEAELKRKSRAIEASMEGIAIIERDESIGFANAAFARLFGYEEPRELSSRSWKVLYDQQQLRKLERHVFISFRRAGSLKCEAIGLRKDGSNFAHELSLTALGDGGLVCIVRDITQRKEAEQHLMESRRFLRKVIDTDPNFIFVKDRYGRFTLVNQAVADLYGARVEDLIGKSDADFNNNLEEVRHFAADDAYVIQSGEELKISEEKVTDSQGKARILQTVKRPLRMPRTNEVHVLGVSTDISAMKRLQDQLVQSQKMEALGQLAGGIAHDFNNMMTGILGYAALLKLEAGDSPSLFRSADMIERAANRAAELTQKLLGFARKGKHQNVPTDLHGTIKETLGIIGRTVERNIVVETRLSASNAFVRGDPVQLQQVILNLAINARDAMMSVNGGTGSGCLVIETENAIPPSAASTSAASGVEWLRINVRDTGCGIAQEIKEKIFEPFFTTKTDGRGSGMGLAMVYGIVTNHGGSIEVSSTVGQGTTFTIWLPISEKPAALDDRVEKMPAKPEQHRGLVLVVDDHEVAREATAEMLRSMGYEVITAGDGAEAMDLFKSARERIALVIIDLVMPRMGAKECLIEMRKLKPELRAILCTGYVKNASVQEMLRDGLTGFLQKPFQLDTLARTVSETMERQVPSASAELGAAWIRPVPSDPQTV